MPNLSTLSFKAFASVSLFVCLCGCKQNPTQDVDAVPTSPRALDIVPFSELNAGGQLLDSHANDWKDSRLVMEYASYGNLYQDVLGMSDPHYPRMAKMANGGWIVLCHNDQSGTVNGNTVNFALSDDMKIWRKCGELFSPKTVKTSSGKSTDRIYTNGYVLSLRNGEVLAVASYRLSSGYGNVTSQPDHGIAMRRSSDFGQTWSEETEIYHGTNWEAQLLELENGELQCYFSESRPWISGGHSGTGMVKSLDGGLTWSPDRVGNPYTIAREMYTHYESGLSLYTYQMPAVIRLNSGNYAGAFESRKNNSSAYGISMAWSNGFWNEIVDNDGSYPVVTADKCGPENRSSYLWTGASPTMFQFPSGETIVGYGTKWNGSYHLLYRMGDATAHNFGELSCALPNQGSWGQVALVGTHEMVAVNRDSQLPGKVGISFARYALNHRISASSRKIVMDGRNSEWSRTDEAVFVGSKQVAQATMRCSSDSRNIYFLIEVTDPDIKSGDYIRLYAAPYYTSSPDASCVLVEADWSGMLTAGYHNGSSWPEMQSEPCCGSYSADPDTGIRVAAGYEGTLDDDGNIDSGYLAEICIPRKSIRVDDNYILVNFGIVKSGMEKDADLLASPASIAKWIPVEVLKK